METQLTNVRTQNLTDGGRLVSGYDDDLLVLLRYDARGQLVEVKREAGRDVLGLFLPVAIAGAGLIAAFSIMSTIGR